MTSTHEILTPKRMAAMVDYHKAFNKTVFSFYNHKTKVFRVSLKPIARKNETIISSYDVIGGMQLEID